jgi:hypothetical protein
VFRSINPVVDLDRVVLDFGHCRSFSYFLVFCRRRRRRRRRRILFIL